MTAPAAPTKAELLASLESSRDEFLAMLRPLQPEAFEQGRYESGWNGREILAHVAAIEWTYPRLFDVAREAKGAVAAQPTGEPATAIARGGIDDYNRRQVEKRAEVPVAYRRDAGTGLDSGSKSEQRFGTVTAAILHVDLDAFYVAMELLRQPDLGGKPVIVAGGLGARGVVNTASYEARAFGVRSAMAVSQARRLCPHGVYLESDYRYYATGSRQFHAILERYTPAIERAGADEAYLDVRGSERLFGDGPAIGADIRVRIRDEIGITASVGVATNKLVAKVASDAAKPDGLLVVEAGQEAEFLAPRPIRDLPMVGPRLAAELTRLGVRTIGQLAAMPPESLASRFGSHGAELHARALGRFDGQVVAGRQAARSISRSITFDTDVADGQRLRAVLLGQAEQVARDLTKEERSARTVTLRLRFPPFETLTRSATPGAPVELQDEIFGAAAELFERTWREHQRAPVRLIGLGVSNLQPRARQLRLGETAAADRLAETVAGIRERYGESLVRRAAELGGRDER